MLIQNLNLKSMIRLTQMENFIDPFLITWLIALINMMKWITNPFLIGEPMEELLEKTLE